MRSVVIGASGQLGEELSARVPEGELVRLTHGDVDLCDRAALDHSLRAARCDVVFNAAAFNLVDDAESRPSEAFAVNAFGVRGLAEVCAKLGVVLVHFSSDYVFGIEQDRDRPYGEESTPGPLSVYGLSKLAGEYFVRTSCPRHFVVRTCGLYGARGSGGKGRNFVRTMLRLGRERGRVRVVNDQTCTPTSAADLAAAALQLVGTGAFGLYHWTNSGHCTWYEFAGEIFRQAGLAVECTPITSEEFGAAALRPKYSVLSTASVENLGLPRPRAWQDALREFLRSEGY